MSKKRTLVLESLCSCYPYRRTWTACGSAILSTFAGGVLEEKRHHCGDLPRRPARAGAAEAHAGYRDEGPRCGGEICGITHFGLRGEGAVRRSQKRKRHHETCYSEMTTFENAMHYHSLRIADTSSRLPLGLAAQFLLVLASEPRSFTVVDNTILSNIRTI